MKTPGSLLNSNEPNPSSKKFVRNNSSSAQLKTPNLLIGDSGGNLFDLPDYDMACMSARAIQRVRTEELIELPQGSQLYYLPGRKAVGYHRKTGKETALNDVFAVAAYIPPSYSHYALSAYEMTKASPRLPLFSYTAVGFLNGRYYVPAVHIDDAVKQLPTVFDTDEVEKKVRELTGKFPGNRLIAHHGSKCAIQYGCANAKNLFLNRWEAPIAVASACNANCVGCISFQPQDSVPPAQNRLDFVPTVGEMVELAVPHLETAENAIISFGQGCEGEPLLHGDLIARAIRAIRSKTSRGLLHINTNGSRPDTVEKLFEAGLDSIRVSMNSAQPELYHRYYKPNNYTFDDVVQSLILARKMNKFSSINYFVFPGITDSEREVDALIKLIEKTQLNLIQWRNLNIDPDWYLAEVCSDYFEPFIGVHNMMEKIRSIFPSVEFGYNNKSKEEIAAYQNSESAAT